MNSEKGMLILIPVDSMTNATSLYPFNDVTTVGDTIKRMGMERGRWWAMRIEVTMPQPPQNEEGVPANIPRKLNVVRRKNGVNDYSYKYSDDQFPINARDYPMYLTCFCEDDEQVQDYAIRLVIGHRGPTAVVYLRNLICAVGDTEAEALAKVQTYFDGSSPGFTFNDQYVKPYWEGTPFRSKSFFTWKSWIPDPPPTIQWDDETKRSFQAGLDRGVLYLQDGTTVPWNGLISVDADDEANAEVESYYIDGLKLLDVSGYGEFEASLSAFTTPREFDRCVGFSEIDDGLTVTSQRRESFGLSYRTLVGDPQRGLRRGYKIHLIYGATALSESENHQTIGDNPDAMTLSWKLKTVAQHIPGRAPSAHLIIDTRYMYSSSVAALEAVLYGADQPPRLPTPTEVLDIVEEASGLRVIDNGDGTFTVESDIPNVVKKISDTEFELDWETVSTSGDTYTVTSF